MSNVKVQALQAFSMVDSDTGAITSIACGAVASVDSEVATDLIADGLAVAYTLVEPTGKLTLNSTAETDCAAYATAQVVDANLVAGNIKDGVTILGVAGSYTPSDANLIPENIKSGVTIFGVTGSYSG